jgi:hypothetical protein
MESKFLQRGVLEVTRLFDSEVQRSYLFSHLHYKVSCDSFLGNRDEA